LYKIKVIESFVSWQGEGPDTGKRMLILRFKKCNRQCPFCDTQVKMRISKETEISMEEVQKIIIEEKCGIMITGGSPTIEENLESTIMLINKIDCKIFNVETNGYQLIKLIEFINEDKNVKYILSPKIFSEEDYTFYTDLISKIIDNQKVYIKLVYQQRDFIIRFLDFLTSINFSNDRVFLMPEGTTKEKLFEHVPMVFDIAEKYKYNFSSREHIIYGFV
jgi:organic radical activating enzyme